MLQKGDALIGWVWLGIEAPRVIRKMNTEQLRLQPELDALTACRGHLENDGKIRQVEAWCLFPVNLALLVGLQWGTEKRRREPEVSVRAGWLRDGEAGPEGRRKVVFVCVYV